MIIGIYNFKINKSIYDLGRWLIGGLKSVFLLVGLSSCFSLYGQ